jgi:hypothetical protein
MYYVHVCNKEHTEDEVQVTGDYVEEIGAHYQQMCAPP